jgi:two-component system OmpR family response regulator
MRILIVEDEPTLCAQLRMALEEQGYAVDIANNGEDGLHMGKEEAFDVAILDLGLPKLDGISVLKGWRLARKKLPVIILTARDNWSERVSGIDAGADDYLTKPFHMEELLARIRSVIRRTAGHSSPVLSIKGLILDTRSSKVSLNGNPITLTAHEFKLLEYLMHHPNEVIDRATLGEHIYAYNEDPDSNTIEVFIARLRKKIPEGLIETIRGLGYRLNDDL